MAEFSGRWRFCGEMRYVSAAAPELAHDCHCTDCRRVSGTAFDPRILSVKAGSADGDLAIDPIEIWTRSRIDWAEIPTGLTRYLAAQG